MIGSGYVTAVTLQQKFKYTGKAYVLGSPSLAAELSQVGVTSVGIGVRHRLQLLHLFLGCILLHTSQVPWSVCLLGTQLKPSETTEPVRMQFGVSDISGPRDRVLDGVHVGARLNDSCGGNAALC